MAKKILRTNWRVEVYADDFMARSADEMERRCRVLANDIKRHIDGFTHIETVADSEGVCEHCGSPWTEDDNTFNGGCCEKDLEGEPSDSTEAA